MGLNILVTKQNASNSPQLGLNDPRNGILKPPLPVETLISHKDGEIDEMQEGEEIESYKKRNCSEGIIHSH